MGVFIRSSSWFDWLKEKSYLILIIFLCPKVKLYFEMVIFTKVSLKMIVLTAKASINLKMDHTTKVNSMMVNLMDVANYSIPLMN